MRANFPIEFRCGQVSWKRASYFCPSSEPQRRLATRIQSAFARDHATSTKAARQLARQHAPLRLASNALTEQHLAQGIQPPVRLAPVRQKLMERPSLIDTVAFAISGVMMGSR